MFLNNPLKFLMALPKMSAIRQAVILTGLFLLILLIAGLTSAWLLSQNITDNVDNELRTRHQLLSKQLANSQDFKNLLPISPLLFASLQTPNGQIFGPRKAQLFRIKGFKNIEIEIGDDDDNWRVYSAATASGKLVMAINMESRYKVLRHVGRLFFWMGALTTLITLVVAISMGLRTQRRLNHIHNTLEEIAAGNLSARINAKINDDDLGAVAQRIDAATVQLETLMRQSKELSANIAHDLKTPLARMRAKLEVALSLDDSELVNQNIEQALDQSDQMIATFEAILRIAHLSSGQYRQRFSTLSLDKLVRETAEIYQPVIEDSQHLFVLKIATQVQIQGDRELIIQLLANLLENAMRHTPIGSTITLSCLDNQLSVSDNGPGIAADKRAKVLEPMYRLEHSRSTAGNGLGLSLVETISQLHHAQLRLSATSTDTENPGLMVNICFDNH